MADHCSASVQAACELKISSSLLVIAQNKHEWTSEGIISSTESCPVTLFFKFTFTGVNLLSCLVCLSNKMADSVLWLVRSPVNQTPAKGQFLPHINRIVRYKHIYKLVIVRKKGRFQKSCNYLYYSIAEKSVLIWIFFFVNQVIYMFM